MNGGAKPGECLQDAIENIETSDKKKNEAFLCTLVEKGADPHIFEGKGSCLIEATKKGYVDLVTLLCNAGTNVNLTGSDGSTAVLAACRIGIYVNTQDKSLIFIAMTLLLTSVKKCSDFVLLNLTQ